MNILRNLAVRPHFVLRRSTIPAVASISSSCHHRSVVCSAQKCVNRLVVEPIRQAVPTTGGFGIRSLATQAKLNHKKAKAPTSSPLEELKANVIAYRRAPFELLNLILAKPEDIGAGSYDFLLGCCGRLLVDQPVEARMKLFRSLWFMATSGSGSGQEVPLDRWKILLQVYRENGVGFEEGVGGFLAGVKVEKDQEFYELLLGVVCERGDKAGMGEVMEVLKERGMGLSTKVARVLIRGHSKAGDLGAVRTILDTMSAGNVDPDGGCYGELIVGYMANQQMDMALKLLKEKGSLLKESIVVEALKEALVANQREAIKLLVKLLPEDVVRDTSLDPMIRNLSLELFRQERFEAVLQLLEELPVPKFKANENYDSYGVPLILELFKMGAPLEEITRMVEFLIKTERNTRALHVACECAAKFSIEHYPKLLGILRKQEDLRPHYFWPLIVQNFEKSGEAGILDALKLMQRYKTELDPETISTFILPKLSITLKDVRTSLKQFEDRGVRMSVLMTPFVSHLLYQNRFQDAVKVVKLYSSKIDTEALIYPLVLQTTVNKSPQHFQTISEVIRALKDKAQNPKHDLAGQVLMELISNKKTKHDASTLKPLLQQFSAFQLRISRMAANVLKTHFSKKRLITADLDKLLNSLVDDKLTIPAREMFDTIIVHPRDMSYEELECHLSELEEKKLNARGVLRRLLQVCVRENRLDRAVEIKQKCDEAKVELSSGMLASVLDLHIKRKSVEEAGKTLEQIKTLFPGFLLDEHKIVDFAALLAEQGYLSTAQNVLKQRASAGQIRAGNSNKNIWNLLNNTAQWAAQKDPNSEQNHTSQTLDFLVNLGYCNYDNALLGPVIREYLLKNQIPAAVAEYKRIASEKNRTPLQLEMFTTLVRLTNSNDPKIPPDQAKTFLADLIQIGSKIHGSVNTNNTLIVALAEAGTEAQLRRILINPESRVNHEYILTQCEFLVNAGKLDVVLRLAKCSRGLANVKEADFLGVVLKQYARDNNCEAAVQLFNRLQAEEGEMKISGDFARKLIDLLEVNNYEVPNAVRLYAK